MVTHVKTQIVQMIAVVKAIVTLTLESVLVIKALSSTQVQAANLWSVLLGAMHQMGSATAMTANASARWVTQVKSVNSLQDVLPSPWRRQKLTGGHCGINLVGSHVLKVSFCMPSDEALVMHSLVSTLAVVQLGVRVIHTSIS